MPIDKDLEPRMPKEVDLAISEGLRYGTDSRRLSRVPFFFVQYSSNKLPRDYPDGLSFSPVTEGFIMTYKSMEGFVWQIRFNISTNHIDHRQGKTTWSAWVAFL